MIKCKKFINVCVITILIVVVFGFIYNYIYSHYYKIDITPYNYSFFARYAESPDKQHAIGLTIYRTEKDSNITYIMGTIDTHNGYSKDSKTIFWQKVDTESLKDRVIDGEVLTDWIDLDWIDNNTVKINGIVLSINKVYDYRRN